MSGRKRSAKTLAPAIPAGPDMLVELIYESDPDGRPVLHHRSSTRLVG